MDYKFTQELPNHHYRTEIPNIVYELGLTPIQFSLYAYIKRITGDNGSCFQSVKTMAKNTSTSESSVKYAIKFMCQPFALLGGASLLKKMEKMSKDGEHQPNLVKVEDIWVVNGDHFRSKLSKSDQLQSHNGTEVGQQMTQVGQQNATKKNPIRSSSSSLSKDKKETTTLPGGSSSFSSLEKLKVCTKTKLELSEKHSQEEVDLAVERVLRWPNRWNDEAAIRTVLERKDDWEDTENHEELLSKLRPFDGKEIKGHDISVTDTYFEITCGPMWIKHFKVSDKMFNKKVLDLLEERGLKELLKTG